MLLMLKNVWPLRENALEFSERDLKVAELINFRMKVLSRKFCMELLFFPERFMCVDSLYKTFWDKWETLCESN